jgi:hypothetical protein
MLFVTIKPGFIDYTHDSTGGFMPKSAFDRIIDWPFHPQMIIAIAFACCFILSMQGDSPTWAALIVAAIAAPVAAFALFLPYLLSITLLAALLSLPQAIRAFCHCSDQKAH